MGYHGLPTREKATPMRITDQVLRLKAFQDANPDVVIAPPDRFRTRWAAEWNDDHGSTIITRYELVQLLDALEERFA
jgi:hypothetical protein